MGSSAQQMTKADETILDNSCNHWIAVGVIANRASLIAALTQLTAARASRIDLWLVATPEAVHSLMNGPNGHGLDPFHGLLRTTVETKLPGYELTILASPGLVADRLLLLDILHKVGAHVADGSVMLGASVKNSADLAGIGRILLRHSSDSVYVRQHAQALVPASIPATVVREPN
jgi:hypothetical protein